MLLRLAAFLIFASLWAGNAVAQAPLTAIVAVSEGAKDYEEVAEAIRSQLSRPENGGIEVVVKPWQELVNGGPVRAKVLVSVGSSAFGGLVEASNSGRLGKVPIVATLLPRSTYESIRKHAVVQTTAVVLDQPLPRQMALLRYAFPNLRRIGVLMGPDSQQHQIGLERAATEQGLQLSAYKVDGEPNLYPALQRLLEENDVLLAIPDAAVYNGGSIQNVLLAAYRQKVPLMGYSPAYVRAGALLALYSTPAQVGLQTSRMVRMATTSSSLPAVQAPTDFVVAVNANVARSLGFRLSDDALRIQLLNREGL